MSYSTRMLQVRAAILRGLQSFPAEPGMLALFLDAEKFSGSQQRVVHHLYEVMIYVPLPTLLRFTLTIYNWLHKWWRDGDVSME